tara:strand:+ start:4927 stop:5400 length:474 start_codon:yes stop_codon:yes gene_type:complete
MANRLKIRRKKGPVVAKKITYNNITFASGLEKYMYIALKKAKIKFKYEGESFILVKSFNVNRATYERQNNGKGEYIDRGNKKILGIKYTPDFVGKDFIIETKGRANESFPMRWKLFKKHLMEIGDNRLLYKPQTNKECDRTVELITRKRTWDYLKKE